MTVIVDLGAGSVSGKKVRIDMLQAGEFVTRPSFVVVHRTSDGPSCPQS
jgi:hypothetical protein